MGDDRGAYAAPAPRVAAALGACLILAFAAAAVLPQPSSAAPSPSPSVSAVLDGLKERLQPSVVQVISYRPMGPALRAAEAPARMERIEPFRGTLWATGIVLDAEGHVLTCAEAAQPGDSLQIRTDDGKIVGAQFLAQDPWWGVSLLRVRDRGALSPLQLPSSTPRRTGQRMMALHYTAQDGPPAFAMGSLTELPGEGGGRSGEMVVSVPGCRGICGGVIVDCEGHFQGMAIDVRVIRESDVGCSRAAAAVDGLGCGEMRVLTATRLEVLARDLKEKALHPTGFLGVRAEAARSFPGEETPASANAPERLWIVRVLPGSPAEVAGVQPGDQILSIDGRPLEDDSQVAEWVAALPPGTPIEVRLLRRGIPVVARPVIGDRSALDWMERQDQLNLLREKDLRQCIRELENRVADIQEQRSRFR